MRKQTITNQDGTTEEVVRFNGTIRSISGEAVEFGTNNKVYYRATVEFTNKKGAQSIMGARIFGGNMAKAEEEETPFAVGDERMCTMQTYQDAEGKNRYSITISHLRYTELVSFEEAMEVFGMQTASPVAPPAAPVAAPALTPEQELAQLKASMSAERVS